MHTNIIKHTRWLLWIVPIACLTSHLQAALPNAEEAQLTNTLLMITPDHFAYNPETATTNKFQHFEKEDIAKKAMQEFNKTVETLRREHIEILVLPSRKDIKTPDAVFPNNWVAFFNHENTVTMILFPMLNKSRRLERQPDQVKDLLHTKGIKIKSTFDFTPYATNNEALEGTGSLVLDRRSKLAFASLSPRTDLKILREFATRLNYKPISFKSYDRDGQLIYHTNVMMSIGDKFAVLCEECIVDAQERKRVKTFLEGGGKEIITISLDQVYEMCGNLLQVKAKDGQKKIIMSQRALDAFKEEQKEALQKFGKLVPVDVTTIETVGGGSVRCMLAEVFY